MCRHLSANITHEVRGHQVQASESQHNTTGPTWCLSKVMQVFVQTPYALAIRYIKGLCKFIVRTCRIFVLLLKIQVPNEPIPAVIIMPLSTRTSARGPWKDDVKCSVPILLWKLHHRGERGRKGRECKFQNKAHRTFDPRSTLSPVCQPRGPVVEKYGYKKSGDWQLKFCLGLVDRQISRKIF